MNDEKDQPEQGIEELPELRGLRLQVLRSPGNADQTNGGLSGKYDMLTLVGTIDPRSPTQEPSYSLLPEEYRMAASTADAPAVWAVQARNTGNYYLIPGNEETGAPQLRGRSAGGNYAIGIDAEFSHVVGTPYAIPIHDKTPSLHSGDANRNMR